MPSDQKNNTCTIVVSSCDAYSDAWYPFFTLFFKYWSDCPFSMYLISDRKKYLDSRVNVLQIEDKKWASNMLEALGSIKTPYILYMQEDYFLKSRVDTKKILWYVEKMSEWDAGYLRLMPSPKPDRVFEADHSFGVISTGSPYRVSLQAAIWSVETLKKILRPGESGWDMEKKGSERSGVLSELFLSSYKPVLDYYAPTAIKKGRWMPGALWLCKKEGIVVDVSVRPTISLKAVLVGRLKNSIFVQGFKRVLISFGLKK